MTFCDGGKLRRTKGQSPTSDAPTAAPRAKAGTPRRKARETAPGRAVRDAHRGGFPMSAIPETEYTSTRKPRRMRVGKADAPEASPTDAAPEKPAVEPEPPVVASEPVVEDAAPPAEAATTSMEVEVINTTPNAAEMRARDLTNRIKNSVSDLAGLLKEAHDTKAWEVLGYETWKDYCRLEIHLSEVHTWRLIQYAESLGPLGLPIGNPVKESQLRPLATFPLTSRRKSGQRLRRLAETSPRRGTRSGPLWRLWPRLRT